MPRKSAMTSVLDGLKETIATRKEQLNKTANESISTTQGTSENSAPSPSSDSEVGDILPHGVGVPAEPKDNLISEKGVEVGQSVPGQPTPSEEQKQRKETSPETKLAAADFAAMRNRLAGVVKTAADKVALYLEQKKAGDGIPAPGSDDPQTTPPIPTGGTDMSLGNDQKNDTSAGAPKVPGTQGVTQTEVSGGKPKTDLEQGTQEQKVGGVIDLDALATKVAMVSHHYGVGQAIGYQFLSMMQGGGEGNNKTASAESINETVIAKIATAGANDILGFAVNKGLITMQQAESIQKEAGIAPHPVDVAIHKYQTKVAALMKEKSLTPETAAKFISKVAMHDKTANEMVGGDPAAAGGVQPEMQEVVQQIAMAVESGQMTEEQALQVLQELGIPVDQILAQQGGAPGAAPGGAPAGADPMAAAAGGAPAPTGALPPEAAAGGAGAPPMSDPAASAEVAGAMGDPAAAAAADPALAAAAAGGAPAGAPPAAPAGAGAPPSEPPAGGGGEKKPEGGEKKEEGGEKKSEGGEKKKEEGGEKKEEGGEKKSEGGEKKSEGSEKCANDGTMPAGAPPADPMAAAGGDPAAMAGAAPGGDPAAGGGDPQQLLQQIVTDLEAAVKAGLMTEQQAQEVLADLTGGGAGGGDPAAAAAGAAPAPDPNAMAADPAAAGAPPVPAA